MKDANRELVENALRGVEARIEELQNLRSTYLNWLGGEDGYGHLPPHSGRGEGRPRKCSKCGQQGHNAATCTAPAAEAAQTKEA